MPSRSRAAIERNLATKVARVKRLREARDQEFLARRREYRRTYEAKPGVKEKLRARRLTRTLIAAGKLTRGPCEKCGDLKTHGHHDDYARPAEVRWLCPACHKKEHRK